MDTSGRQMDARVITLKRWSLPQSRSLYQIWRERGCAECYGEYVSFQHFHFIDISPIKDSAEHGIFPLAYEVVSSARQKNEQGKCKDIYIQQSIVVYGELTSFWDKKPEILYLTMIQLTNRQDLNVQTIQTDIKTLIDNRGVPKDSWALYYSLDFCDLVLFVKNQPMSVVQDIIWNLSPIRMNSFKQIRDTVTVYGLDSTRLMQSFEKYAMGQNDVWTRPEDHLTLLVSIGVRELDAWVKLKQSVENLPGVKSSYFQILGRFDVQLVLENIEFCQVLQVLWLLDNACGSEHNQAFRCYEVVPMELWKGLAIKGQLDEVDCNFHTVADSALDQLFQIYTAVLKDVGEPTRGYASEIRRALTALLDNGFSEEFVLSVLYSFTEYLRFVAELMGKQPCKNDMNERRVKSEKLYTFQRNYLQALNMLAHCTMHSERQFIQAPSFNATIFDVPPKLLAFYAGVAFKVTALLNDEDRTYSFLFSPDFRSDIYVRPISSEGYSSKLLIIYINEQMFYNPSAVIETMCHEIAHHVGKNARCREERMERILDCIGINLICSSLPIRDCSLVKSLAHVICIEAKDEYERWFDQIDASDRRYYLTSVADFLKKEDYLCLLIEYNDFLDRLRHGWAEVMENFDVTELMEFLGRTMHSDYIAQMYADPETRGAALDQLAGEMTRKLWTKLRQWKSVQPTDPKSDEATPLFEYFSFCECILQTFSESYADLRMLDVLEIDCWQEYMKLLEANLELAGSHKVNWGLQEYLRGSSILACLGAGNDVINQWYASYGANGADRLILRLYQDRLEEYLKLCRRRGYGPDKDKIKQCGLHHLVQCICASNPSTVFSTIRNTTLEYRQELQCYCKNITAAGNLKCSAD